MPENNNEFSAARGREFIEVEISSRVKYTAAKLPFEKRRDCLQFNSLILFSGKQADFFSDAYFNAQLPTFFDVFRIQEQQH